MSRTVPVLHEIEVNITRLLGASLTLLAKTSLFLHQPLPPVSMTELCEAIYVLEGQNRALILNGALGGEVMLVMQRNAGRITQLAVLVRVIQHLERACELLSDEERALVVRLLGPSADSVFLLGTRLLAALLETPLPAPLPHEKFTWELVMVDGAFQVAREELTRTAVFSRSGRRYARATLWALQVARDAFLIVGSR
jgi:hypothetical protein